MLFPRSNSSASATTPQRTLGAARQIPPTLSLLLRVWSPPWQHSSAIALAVPPYPPAEAPEQADRPTASPEIPHFSGFSPQYKQQQLRGARLCQAECSWSSCSGEGLSPKAAGQGCRSCPALCLPRGAPLSCPCQITTHSFKPFFTQSANNSWFGKAPPKTWKRVFFRFWCE